MDNYNSAFSGGLTVAQIVENPQILEDGIRASLEGAFIENAIFRNGGEATSPVINYREDTVGAMGDEPEVVAEFGDIPATHATIGKLKTTPINKVALGVRISREMIKYNSMEMITKQVNDLQTTLVRSAARDLVAALNDADTHTMQASAPWVDRDTDTIHDIITAKYTVSTAGDGENQYGYAADTLVINNGVADFLVDTQRVQNLFVGNVADQNPVYRGILPESLNGLTIVTSSFIPEDVAFVLNSGRVGFFKDADPLTVTPMYAEFGDNNYGGVNQSYRVDAFRARGLAVTAPKSVVKITGLTQGGA